MQPRLAARPRAVLLRGSHQVPRQGAGVPRAPPQPCGRCVGAAAGGGSAAGDGGSDRCSSLQECMDKARHRARKLEDGAIWVPLTMAKGFFEAGLRACTDVADAQGRAAEAEEACATEIEQEKAWLEDELLALADVAQHEREKHEMEMRRILQFARTLETEVDAAKRSLKHKVEEAEERVAHRYQEEAEAATAAAAAAAGGDPEQLKRALQAATASQHAWRARALQVERQFAQLRGMIEARMVKAAEAATDMRRTRERDEEAAAAELRRKHLGDGGAEREAGQKEAQEWEAAGLDPPA